MKAALFGENDHRCSVTSTPDEGVSCPLLRPRPIYSQARSRSIHQVFLVLSPAFSPKTSLKMGLVTVTGQLRCLVSVAGTFASIQFYFYNININKCHQIQTNSTQFKPINGDAVTIQSNSTRSASNMI